MSRPVVIFGASGSASLARHCLMHDADRNVVAFTVDAAYVSEDNHDGLPLVPFEHLPERYPPERYDILLPMGYTRMNALRQERLVQARELGFRATSYVSSRSSVWLDTPILDNTLIYEHSTLQSYVTLGENVIVRAGANIGHHGNVGSHCFVASGVVTGGRVTIGEHCFIGLGAVVRDRVTLGPRCFIGAGAVVLADTEPDGVYAGNPARRLDKNSLELTAK
jgi:sugar O-acyltransferase (sialic acid O-acetyltransferase NeuD family)